MRMPHWLWTTLAIGALAFAGCSDDDDDNGNMDGGTEEDGGGEEDSGTEEDGGGEEDSGTEEDGGGEEDSGAGGDCDLSGDGKDKEEIPNPIDEDTTLTSDKVWQLKEVVHVADGATLTIEPCTRIEGFQGSGSSQPGTLVVTRGAMIDAVGTADEPILFTTQVPEGSRSPELWGGVILLGKATNNEGENVLIEGLLDDDENKYGGDEDGDNSGKFAYVRIEYGGFELGAQNEINGLTMGSVGSETEIHHVMVNTTQDDCFEWFGGTVNAHHLVCNGVGDDMFDADQGYKGSLEYIFGRADDTLLASEDPNGFEFDSSREDKQPNSEFSVSHATLCGADAPAAGVAYGMVLRRNVTGALDDVVATAFDYGVDVRDGFGDVDDPSVTIENSLFFGMAEDDIRGEETGDEDNDSGFDEDEWFEMGDGNEVPSDAPFTAADCLEADGPNDAVLESGVGAFSGDVDEWNWGAAWMSWETE